MTSHSETKPTYSVAFVDRTGMERISASRGHSHLRMPLKGNENHVDMLYMGAYAVLAEACAAGPGISILDTARFFPIIKDIYVDFHKPAFTDVDAEYTLPEEEIEKLQADLESKGSAGYTAEIPMTDAEGTRVATGRVTVKLLSHDWPGKD